MQMFKMTKRRVFLKKCFLFFISPAPIIQAMLLTVGNLYANREPVAMGTIVTAVPYTFEYLKGLYKKHALA